MIGRNLFVFKSRPGYTTNPLNNTLLSKQAKQQTQFAPISRHCIFALPIIFVKDTVPKHTIPPKVVTPKPTAKRKDFIVQYYIWDIRKNDFTRCRRYVADKIQANRLKSQITGWLHNDWYLNEKGKAVQWLPHSAQQKPKKMISEAVDAYLEVKVNELRPTTYRGCKSYLKNFIKWIVKHKQDIPVNEFSYTDLQDFFAHVLQTSGARTRNNFRAYITSMLRFARKNGWTDNVITEEFPKLKEETPRNWHYSPEQQKTLGQYMRERWPDMRFACLWMYYTLMRPSEMSKLKIKDIGRLHRNKIHISAQNSKNKNERHVTIPVQLQEMIHERKLRELDPEWFVFSNNYQPGPKMRPSRYLAERYRENVLNKLQFPLQYTFYSWKHTGVVSNLRNGVPDIDIFEQGGWTDWSSFRKYINNLGVKENTTLRNNYSTAHL